MDDGTSYGAPRRRGIAGPALLILLAFACGLGLAAWAVHRWDRVAAWLHPMPPTVTIAPRPPASVAPHPAVAPVPAGPDPALVTQVDALDDRVDALDARTQEARGDADRAESLLVAFAARRAIDRGQPLGYVEGLLHRHFAADDGPAVAMVIGAAQHPVTLLHLQNGFAAIAPALVTPGPEDSWWTGVKRQLGGLFVVRKAQTPSTEPAEQRARAERALEQGAVDEAMREVLRMPGSARATDWIGEARRYVLTHNALDRIEAAALLDKARPVTP